MYLFNESNLIQARGLLRAFIVCCWVSTGVLILGFMVACDKLVMTSTVENRQHHRTIKQSSFLWQYFFSYI